MGVARALPLVFLVAAVLCFVAAIATGGARAGIFVIFPFVIGGSWLTALGALFGFGAIATSFLLVPWEPAFEEPAPGGVTEPAMPRSGGVVLVGPVPVFFGGWKRPPRWAYWSAVLAGVLLFTVVLVAALVF